MCTHTHTLMTTKTITITTDAYDLLARNKLPSESFSQAIKRSFDKKKSILDLSGVWADISDKDATEMKETIETIRKESKSRI